jgi:hypothetical protein
MASWQFGPFGVLKGAVRTNVVVYAGDTVRTISEGVIDFGGAVLGGGAPLLDANGDSWPTPPHYPAPALRKNSLICGVGGAWYQGGTDASFASWTTGELVLSVNDASPEDNSRGWSVTLLHTPLDPSRKPGETYGCLLVLCVASLLGVFVALKLAVKANWRSFFRNTPRKE